MTALDPWNLEIAWAGTKALVCFKYRWARSTVGTATSTVLRKQSGTGTVGEIPLASIFLTVSYRAHCTRKENNTHNLENSSIPTGTQYSSTATTTFHSPVHHCCLVRGELVLSIQLYEYKLATESTHLVLLEQYILGLSNFLCYHTHTQ